MRVAPIDAAAPKLTSCARQRDGGPVMPKEQFLIEEFKCLRVEIMDCITAQRNLEIACIVAMAVMYSSCWANHMTYLNGHGLFQAYSHSLDVLEHWHIA
jgi:hypothetical protein